MKFLDDATFLVMMFLPLPSLRQCWVTSMVIRRMAMVSVCPSPSLFEIILTPYRLAALTSWQTASLKLATPVGNLIGQILFGWLADILGRKRMCERANMPSFIPLTIIGPDGIELVIMIVATFGQAVSGRGPGLNVVSILIVWRVIVSVLYSFRAL